MFFFKEIFFGFFVGLDLLPVINDETHIYYYRYCELKLTLESYRIRNLKNTENTKTVES